MRRKSNLTKQEIEKNLSELIKSGTSKKIIFEDKTLINQELIEAFMSDGSEEENNLLLKLITEEPEWDPELAIVPEKYRTKAFKEWLEQEHEKEKGGYDDLRKKAEKYRGEK